MKPLGEGARRHLAAGNKLIYLDEHLAATSGSKGWYFKMEQEFWVLPFALVLLRMTGFCLGFAEEMRFEKGNSSFSQSVQHLNENLFPFSPASASRAYLFMVAGS